MKEKHKWRTLRLEIGIIATHTRISDSLTGRAGNIVVIIATVYWLDSPGIESEIFRTRRDRPALSPPRLLYVRYRVSFPGAWPPTPSSTEVKERVELYLYSHLEGFFLPTVPGVVSILRPILCYRFLYSHIVEGLNTRILTVIYVNFVFHTKAENRCLC